MTPMRVKTDREVPEYEIDPKELDFTNSVDITKVFLTQIAFYMHMLLCCGAFADSTLSRQFSKSNIFMLIYALKGGECGSHLIPHKRCL